MADEKRLIDANKALARADEVTFMGFKAEERKQHFLSLVSAILEQCTTVEAVPVVRCEKCKFCRTFYPYKEIDKDPIQVWYCDLYWCHRKPNEFCSDGERKDDGTTQV